MIHPHRSGWKKLCVLLVTLTVVAVSGLSVISQEDDDSSKKANKKARKLLQSIMSDYRSTLEEASSSSEKNSVYKSTLKRIEKFLQNHSGTPSREHALALQANLHRNLGNLKESSEVLLSLVSKYGDSPLVPSYYLRLGDGFLMRGKLNRALTTFKKIREKFPKSSEADATHVRIGDLYERQRKYKKALDELKKGTQTETPSISISAKFLLGKLHIFLENKSKAEECFTYVSENANREAFKKSAERALSQVQWIGKDIKELKGSTLSGSSVSANQFSGNVLLIHFWASWSKPSLRSLSDLQSFYSTNRAKGFRILGVCLDSVRSEGKRVVNKYDLSWPHLFDGKKWSSGPVKKYGVKEIPQSFIVDREGTIRYVLLRPPLLLHAVEKLLK